MPYRLIYARTCKIIIRQFSNLPGYFEDSQKTRTTQHRNTEGRQYFSLLQDHFDDREDDDTKVKDVEEEIKVSTYAETVHFYQHFQSKKA